MTGTFGMDGVGRMCSFSMLCVIFVGTVTDADDSVMADVMTKEQRSRCMSRIKGKDTKPEMIVRRWLWSRGYRYRKHVKRLPGTPDIVLRKYGIVIFIHGCFWHGHEEHMHLPKSTADFWTAKIRRNKERDEAQKDRLRAMGWNVLTIWECQLKPAVRARTLASIEYFINHSYLMKQQATGYGDTATETTPMAAESEAAYGSER